MAAFAGMLTALGAREPNADAGFQQYTAEIADAFAEEVDAIWGANAYTNLDVACIRKASEIAWATRSPLPAADATTPGAYMRIATQVVTLSQFGTQRVASHGIDPGVSHPVTSTEVQTVINVKDPKYGAKGDGVADDTAAIQAAINDATISSALVIGPTSLLFPDGIYLISQTLTVDANGPNAAKFNYIIIRGESGGHGFFPAATLRWIGAPQGKMLEISNAKAIRGWNLNLDGNGLASICLWLRAYTTGTKWWNIGTLNTIAIPPWQPGAPYSPGVSVVTPLVPRSAMQDGGHVWTCLIGGISGNTVPNFTLGAGDHVVDNTVTWVESGPSPTCTAVGDLTGPFVGAQVDTSTWRDCTFQGRGFEVHASGTSPPNLTISISDQTKVIPAHQIGIIIKTSGGVGVGTFQWILNGIPQTTQAISSTFVLGNTGYTANFPPGVYHNDTLYVGCQTTAAGWRALSGANVKVFMLDSCQFQECGVGMDAHYGSGAYLLNQCTFGANFCDLGVAGAQVTCNGLHSEGSGFLLYGNLGTTTGAACALNGCVWFGNTPLLGGFTNYGAGDAFIAFGGTLAFNDGCVWSDTSCSFPLILEDGAGLTLPVEAGAIRSRGTVFFVKQAYIDGGGELFFPAFDGSTNAMLPGSRQYYQGYGGGGAQIRVSSDGDYFLADTGSVNIPIYRYDGQDLRLGRQMLTSQPEEISPGVTVVSYGTAKGACSKYTIKASQLALGATNTATLTLTKGWGKSKVTAVYMDVPGAFGGGALATLTAEVGKTVPVIGGVTTSNAYLLASSIMTATKYGLNAGDVGAALTNPVQGGDMIWGVTDGVPSDTKRWALQVTLRSTGDTLNHIATGTLDIYVEFDVLPGFNA